MTFYSRDALDKPIFIDKNVNYSYQSFGKLSKDGPNSTYRMLFETQDGIHSRDYHYNDETKSFAPTGTIKSLCGGVRGYLPAQSKSGDEYSAYDAEKGVTHVYAIGKSGAECKMKETLPGMLGKIDFSPNGKRLAYHVDKLMDDNGSKNIVLAADERNSMESVVFDRETKKAAIIAKSTRSNSYYPVFLDDNTIAFIDNTKIETYQQKSQFTIKLATLDKISTPDCPHCREHGTLEEQASAFIGAIRDKNCEKDPAYYFKNGVSSFSALNTKQCQSVVESCDSKCLTEIKDQIARASGTGGISVGGVSVKAVQNWKVETIANLEKKDLLAFCAEFVTTNSVSFNKKIAPISR